MAGTVCCDICTLSWEALADVTFSEKYNKETDAYWLIPVFGQQPRSNEGKRVIIEGYFIPVDMDSGFYVLSQFPYSSCFFCGEAGPESVVELQMDKKLANKLRMDQRVKIQGTFQTNDSDFDHCNYMLKDAKPLSN